jgi:hypothetical protein
MTAKINKICNILKPIVYPGKFLQYVGWVGYSNLGDEAIKDACDELFKPLGLLPGGASKYRPVEAIRDIWPLGGVLLGGGTLIGHNGPIDEFKYGVQKYGCGVIIGAGVEPVETDQIPNWLLQWREVLVNIEFVGVRGIDSARVLSKVGINAVVTGDTALYFGENNSYWSPLPMHIGINIGQSNGHVYGHEEIISSQYSEFIKLLIIDGWQVEFFCVVPDDVEITLKTAKKAGIERPRIHKIYLDSRKYKEVVKRMSVFVGMKLHSVVLANCAGVPAVMIEYRPKCKEYMESVNMGEYVIRSDSISPNDVMLKVDHVYANKLEISAAISNKVLEYRDLIIKFANLSRAKLFK